MLFPCEMCGVTYETVSMEPHTCAASEEEEMIDEIVLVTKGKHAGRVGYCDEIDDGLAFVYLGKYRQGYVTVRKASLSHPTPEQKAAHSKIMNAPDYY